jgi:hypothetical protein
VLYGGFFRSSPSRPILQCFLRDGGPICRPFHGECLLSLYGPERSRLFAFIAFELVCHPEQRAEDDGAIIAGQVHYTSLDDEAAQFDQVPRALAALDLPCAHIMPPPCCLLTVARRPVAPERRQCGAQLPVQFAAPGSERTRLRVPP